MAPREIAAKFIRDRDAEAVKSEAGKYDNPARVLDWVRYYVKRVQANQNA